MLLNPFTNLCLLVGKVRSFLFVVIIQKCVLIVAFFGSLSWWFYFILIYFVLLVAWPCVFPSSVWSVASSILGRTGLLRWLWIILGYLYHRNLFFLLQLWQITLLHMIGLDWHSWSVRMWSMLFQILLAFKVSIEKLALFWRVFLYKWLVFFFFKFSKLFICPVYLVL